MSVFDNMSQGQRWVTFLLACGAIVAIMAPSEKITAPSLQQAVTTLNSQLPRQEDRITRIDKVIIGQPNKVIIYATITAHGKSDIDLVAFRGVVYESILTSTCLNAPYVDLLKKHGVQLVYVYSDKHSEPLAEFVINSTDCK